MELQIPESDKALQEKARQFMTRHLLPLESQFLAGASLPDDSVKTLRAMLAAAGLDRPQIPGSLGGRCPGFLSQCLVQDELSYSVVGTELCLEENLQLLRQHATVAQEERFVRPMAHGKLHSCFALTEPDAGSDIQSIRATAVHCGSYYSLSGYKAYVRGLSGAGVVLVVARTDTGDEQGLTVWLVDRNDPGLRVAADRRLLSVERVFDLALSDCRLPPERMLGGPGQGPAIVASRLRSAEIFSAARCNGMARRCLDLALQQVQRRCAFGGPLSQLQIVQHQLAERATELHAARLLVVAAASHLDSGQQADAQVAVAKTHAAETARRVADTTVQLHGAQGCVVGTAPEFLYRSSRLGLIANVPTELHRVQIAEAILDRLGGSAG
ncbi:MAG: acyl-CoA dehydrogenase [Gammaproteobacteria bacterium]|nr:MAG: acyl-CoA dehydrogenase [Gammaproteobacteria bacterium]